VALYALVSTWRAECPLDSVRWSSLCSPIQAKNTWAKDFGART